MERAQSYSTESNPPGYSRCCSRHLCHDSRARPQAVTPRPALSPLPSHPSALCSGMVRTSLRRQLLPLGATSLLHSRDVIPASLTSRPTFQPGHDPRQALMSHSEPAAFPGTRKRPSGPTGWTGQGRRARFPFPPPPLGGLRSCGKEEEPQQPGRRASARTSLGSRDLRGRGKGRAEAEGGGAGASGTRGAPAGTRGGGTALVGTLQVGWPESIEPPHPRSHRAPGIPGWGRRQGSVKGWTPENKTAPLPPPINNSRTKDGA